LRNAQGIAEKRKKANLEKRTKGTGSLLGNNISRKKL